MPFFKKDWKNISLLFLGLDGSGKTTMVRKLAGERLDNISPTQGLNTSTFQMDGFKIEVFDLGGGDFCKIWPSFFAEAHGLVFCIDSNDKARMAEANSAMRGVCRHPQMEHKPTFIMKTKLDADCDVGNAEFEFENLMFNQTAGERGCLTAQEADKNMRKSFHDFLGRIRTKYGILNKRVEEDLVERSELRQKMAQERFERVKRRREEQDRLEKEAAKKLKKTKKTKKKKKASPNVVTPSDSPAPPNLAPTTTTSTKPVETTIDPPTIKSEDTATTTTSSTSTTKPVETTIDPPTIKSEDTTATTSTTTKPVDNNPVNTVAQVAMGELTVTIKMDLSTLIAELASVDSMVRTVQATISRTTKPNIATTTTVLAMQKTTIDPTTIKSADTATTTIKSADIATSTSTTTIEPTTNESAKTATTTIEPTITIEPTTNESAKTATTTIEPTTTFEPTTIESAKPVTTTIEPTITAALEEEGTVVNVYTEKITVVYKKPKSSSRVTRRRLMAQLFTKRVNKEVMTSAASRDKPTINTKPATLTTVRAEGEVLVKSREPA